MTGIPRTITKKELRLIVPFSPQHIARLEKKGLFPKRIKIGVRRVAWRLSDIEAWLEQRAKIDETEATV